MRIACFHLNQIGDLVFSLPALKCIRDAFPDAHVTSVVRPSAVELLEDAGLVDEVLVRSGGFRGRKIRLARRLAVRRFDLAVVFSQSAECAILAYLSRAPRRVGFVNTSLGILLTRRAPFTHPPSVENNLRLVEACEIAVTTRDYVHLLRPSAECVGRADRKLVQAGIADDDRIVALSPGTSGRRRVKEWTDDGFAMVARHLVGKGLRVVVIGTVAAEGITRGCPEVIDLSGRTSLGEAAAILARSEALVSVDSGILHLAAAVGTKVVGLYGPSDPRVTGPRGDGHVVLTANADCSPCKLEGCRFERKCMTNLHPDSVIDALEGILCTDSALVRGENSDAAQS